MEEKNPRENYEFNPETNQEDRSVSQQPIAEEVRRPYGGLVPIDFVAQRIPGSNTILYQSKSQKRRYFR